MLIKIYFITVMKTSFLNGRENNAKPKQIIV